MPMHSRTSPEAMCDDLVRELNALRADQTAPVTADTLLHEIFTSRGIWIDIFWIFSKATSPMALSIRP